ncbi:hypothetical protein GCM10010124_40600 [Pilimelia terevasa]|uniref:Uncharacterized protein n=1 Tax=Pilimelia terevasa TaxID=53372 RepID=A0A8J3BUC3_9ACTN|nr:hypothetical protein [Pilimelia terevasa]GGK43709.1 hypothetical protein GCM10010124_40600 [Pilimelia terevasa]
MTGPHPHAHPGTRPGGGAEPVTLPATLAARPTDARRGLPVPPVNEHPDPHGGPPCVDFTTIDTATAIHLATERRCSLCGEPIGYWVGFLGTARTAELGQFADPPGHPECQRAAVRLCPHIMLRHHRRARDDRPGAGMIPPGSHGDKPQAWVLGITRDYRTMFLPEHGYAVYLPAPFRATETYTYGPDGRLNTTPVIRRR